MNFKCRLYVLITVFSNISYISMVITSLVRLTKNQYESEMRRRSCPRLSQIQLVWKGNSVSHRYVGFLVLWKSNGTFLEGSLEMNPQKTAQACPQGLTCWRQCPQSAHALELDFLWVLVIWSQLLQLRGQKHCWEMLKLGCDCWDHLKGPE